MGLYFDRAKIFPIERKVDRADVEGGKEYTRNAPRGNDRVDARSRKILTAKREYFDRMVMSFSGRAHAFVDARMIIDPVEKSGAARVDDERETQRLLNPTMTDAVAVEGIEERISMITES